MNSVYPIHLKGILFSLVLKEERQSGERTLVILIYQITVSPLHFRFFLLLRTERKEAVPVFRLHSIGLHQDRCLNLQIKLYFIFLLVHKYH
jgi:hypothetical protein